MLLSKIRNSPVWLSIVRPPASDTVSGLTAAAGVTEAIRSVPPFVAGALDVLAAPEELVDFDEDPHAATIAPSNGADMPITLPRRRKSRRLSRPETSSSM